jgi:CheY-like chemotaxis protein
MAESMRSVLIVDDHPDIRRLLSVTLGKDRNIVEAHNAIEALEAIQKYRPEVVLLDVMMPGAKDGLDVLDAIKSSPETRSTSVAMISARGQRTDSDDARRRGADAYFIKPFSPLQVVQWVRSRLTD